LEKIMNALANFAPNAHWLLRLALIGPFAFHGLGKFFNLAGTAEMLQMPVFLVAFVGLVEVGGVALIVAGAFARDWMTRLAGLGFAGTMAGAIVLVHAANGWNSLGNMGVEFPLALLLISLYFVIVGNGDSEVRA
jgi:putative oxidoreductase